MDINIIEVTALDTIEKIEHLNVLCDMSLTICCYAGSWEISSYRKDSALHSPRYVMRRTFDEALDIAYAKAIEWEKKQKIQQEIMTA